MSLTRSLATMRDRPSPCPDDFPMLSPMSASRRMFPRRSAVALLVLALAACSGQHGAATSSSGDAAPANDGVGILLNLADEALKDHRLIAPAGANAYEFYLSVLELDPANAVARQNLADNLPSAMSQVEQAITTRDLDEAARELRLLREVDNNNFTLQLLAGKLEAQRAIVVREDEARAAAIQAQAQARAAGSEP